eukprot:355984-Chlamydomonas_euryale.AAC.2
MSTRSRFRTYLHHHTLRHALELAELWPRRKHIKNDALASGNLLDPRAARPATRAPSYCACSATASCAFHANADAPAIRRAER